ncbi:hypothetical protein C7974DRAFT_389702 [Boeremia exigua]|uniref:uncharacterized protein n=1 Tax=Boeremia exigua TaxID=749465 RepID=UPI001E8EAE65|nr:uncharacterized protein C7974DRAFT_389702 [Boeremia exigua]KAH6637535.1 hypothetical protein C7974DRAFT_389702 [Boeremia exigua]
MPSLFSKKKDSEREITQAGTSDDSQVAPPEYVDDGTPPTYKASSYLRSLHDGDPNDKVDVPMIHSVHKLSVGDYLPWGSAMKTGKRTVISRSMTRDCYIKHYATDEEGNYIGTEKPYPDWKLVFVPNKSTPDDILQQLNEFVDVRHDIRRLHERKELKHIPNQ